MAAKYVYESNTFETAIQSLSDPGTVTVEQDAYIQVASGIAFSLTDDGWTFKTDGTIEADAMMMVFVDFLRKSTV